MADPKHAKILRSGVKEWNLWRERNPAIVPDLCGTNLCGLDLRQVDLRGANLDALVVDPRVREEALGLEDRTAEFELVAYDPYCGDVRWELRRAGAPLSSEGESRLEERMASDGDYSTMYGESPVGKVVEVDIEDDDIDISRVQVELEHESVAADELIEAEPGHLLLPTRLDRASLEKARLDGASARHASFRNANLTQASLVDMDLRLACFNDASCKRASFSRSILSKASFRRAVLAGSDMFATRIVESDFQYADISGCNVYGASAWAVDLTGAIQTDLVITPSSASPITVDNLHIAQFIYTLLENSDLRATIDTVAKKLVLILGRFTRPRKRVLDAIRVRLRELNYIPVMFDFQKPAARNLTETVSVLAHMSAFVIADLTDARSVLQELQRIVPDLPSVPVQPILQRGSKHFGMTKDFRDYGWFLPTYRYADEAHLIENLKKHVVDPAESRKPGAKRQALKAQGAAAPKARPARRARAKEPLPG